MAEYMIVTWAPGAAQGKPMRNTFEQADMARVKLAQKLMTMKVGSIGWIYSVTSQFYPTGYGTRATRQYRRYWFMATQSDPVLKWSPRKLMFNTSYKRMCQAKLHWWSQAAIKGVRFAKREVVK